MASAAATAMQSQEAVIPLPADVATGTACCKIEELHADTTVRTSTMAGWEASWQWLGLQQWPCSTRQLGILHVDLLRLGQGSCALLTICIQAALAPLQRAAHTQHTLTERRACISVDVIGVRAQSRFLH